MATQPSKRSLIAMGVLEIVLASLACLLAVFASNARREVAAEPGASVRTLIFWLGMAGALTAFAVGTFQARRWARKLMLSFSWLGLAWGACGIVFLGVFLTSALDGSVLVASGGDGPRRAFSSLALVAVLLIMAVPFVLLPGICVLFYGNQGVAKVFEAHDPKPSWTDRCPTPVLVYCAHSAMGVLCAPLTLLTPGGSPVPVFGVLWEGGSGGAIRLVGWVLAVYVAWGLYHLKASAWWVALGLTAVGGASTVYGVSKVLQVETLERMQVPHATIEAMKGMLPGLGSAMTVSIALASCAGVGYLLFLRRYLVGQRVRHPPSPTLT